jgi:hypothetical protein
MRPELLLQRDGNLVLAGQVSANPGRKPALASALLPLLLVSASAAVAAHEGDRNADILGHWRVSRVVGSADIAAMSDAEARRLVGKRIDIGKNAFVFNGERCEEPTYERSKDDLVKSFREQGHASAAGMGLPDPVTSIDAGCTHLFLKRPGVIVLQWEGFYFDAVRQKH